MNLNILQANAGRLPLKTDSVHCVITSPPYYALRRYNAPDVNYGAWRGQLGLEPTPELFIEHLVGVFREVKRVLREDGVCWVNMGDSYAANRGYQVPDNKHKDVGNNHASKVHAGYKPKDLMLIPQRLAITLQQDGWWVRSFFPWLKASAMPESVQDRPSTAHEYIIMLTKSARFFYDADAVRMPVKLKSIQRNQYAFNRTIRPEDYGLEKFTGNMANGFTAKTNPAGRNRRTTDAWNESIDAAIYRHRYEIDRLEALRDSDLPYDDNNLPMALQVNPRAYPGAHYATFPPALVEPMIKAATSERGVCSACGAQWGRVVDEKTIEENTIRTVSKLMSDDVFSRGGNQVRLQRMPSKIVQTIGFSPTCEHTDVPTIPATVLDIFGGTGVTALVANALGRRGITTEISPEYVELAKERTGFDTWQAWQRGKKAGAGEGWEGTMFEGT